MNAMQTRPIPDFAVDEAIRSQKRAAARRGVVGAAPDFDKDMLDAFAEAMVQDEDRPSPWRIMRDMLGATALSFLMRHCIELPSPPAACEFLAVLDDKELTRPMFKIDEVKPQEWIPTSRAQLSLQPTELSDEEAKAIDIALSTGSARPRIKIEPLPPYRG